MHGDEFDVVVRAARWLAFLGDRGYELALWLNNPLNWVRRHLGLGYWSLSAYLKYRVKSAVAFIGAFEEAVATEASRRGVDGVICGHIHHAADRSFAVSTISIAATGSKAARPSSRPSRASCASCTGRTVPWCPAHGR